MGLFGLHLPKAVDNALGSVGRVAQGTARQINPFDNGVTYSKTQSSGPLPGSIASQATNMLVKPVTNVVAGTIVEPSRSLIADFTGNRAAMQAAEARKYQSLNNSLIGMAVNPVASLINTAVIDPGKITLAQITGNKQAERNANLLQNINMGLGPNGDNFGNAFKQLGGNSAAALLSVAAPGVTSKLGAPLQGLGTNLAAKTVQKALPGATVGAGFNVAGLYGNDPNATAKQAISAAKQGAAFGGLMAAAPELTQIAKKGVSVVAPEVQKAGKAASQTTKALLTDKPMTFDEQALLSDYADMKAGRYTPRSAEAYNLELKARALAKQQGIDIINGSKVDIANRIADKLERADMTRAAQGGFIKVRKDSSPTAEYLKQLTREQELAQGTKSFSLRGTQKELSAKIVDALSPIEKPVEAITGRKGNLALRDALDRSLRSRSIAGEFAKTNGLHDIIQSAPNVKALDQYMIAKHARELEANGIKTGRNLAQDATLVNELSPKYEAQAQALTKYNNTLLDKAQEYGLISGETVQYLKEKYPNYVPMERIFAEGELNQFKGNGAGPASISTQTVVQKIKGSERTIKSPLESILTKTNDLITEGERNLAAREIVKTASLEGNPLGIRELKPGETIGNKSTISMFENGVKKVYEVYPEVAEAAKSLNKEQLGLVGKIVSPFTRTLKLGATSLNPAFTLANLAKDTVSAFINSENSLRTSPANPKVFLEALKASVLHDSPQYSELLSSGAAGTSFDIGRNAAPVTLKKIRAERNIVTKAAYTVTHPGELLRAVEDTIGRSEEFTRASQYYGSKNAALKAGKSLSEATRFAADAARNNTVNFARAGEYGRVLNSVIPYLNAGIQGSRTLLRNLRDRPVRTTSKIVITGFMPVAATTAWNLSSPERKAAYDNISEYEKEHNIIIIPPFPKQNEDGTWNVIKIPMSQEISNLSNIVRNGVESMAGDKNMDFKAIAGNLAGTATSLNVQSPNQLLGQLTPQAVKPFAESALNKNLFTGQPIVPEALKNLSPEDQVSKNTSGTARVLGRLTNMSPLKIDNAIRTSTGGLGQNLINLSDKALAKGGAISEDQVKGQSFGKSVANRFTSAQGQTAGSLYFGSIDDAAKKLKIAGKDYELLSALTAKELDPNGTPVPQTDKDALNNNQILANNPRVAEARAEAAKLLSAKTGKPVDPLYELPPEKQAAFYTMQGSIYKGQAYERVLKENPWITDFQKQRSSYFDKLGLAQSIDSKKVKYPLDDNQKATLEQYFALPKELKSEAIQQVPEISQALNLLSRYANEKQIAQGSAPLDTYPQASKEVQDWTTEYFAQPKGSKMSWQRANPGKWAAVSQQLTQQSLYGLTEEAVAAQYKDTGYTSDGLKDIYNLGQYSVNKSTDPNGQTFYSLGGIPDGNTAVSGGSYRYGGGSGSSRGINPTSYVKRVTVSGGIKKASKVPKVKISKRAVKISGKSGNIKVRTKKIRLA